MNEDKQVDDEFTNFCSVINDKEKLNELANNLCEMNEDDFWVYIEHLNQGKIKYIKNKTIDERLKNMEKDFDS